MKTDLVDVNETRKNLTRRDPAATWSTREIERVARDYSRKARIPGFRPGKAPARVIKQRFKDQILHDVAHDLVPRAVDEALRERGRRSRSTRRTSATSTVEEGQALTFTASFDTVPAFEPGDYATLSLRRPSSRGRRRRPSTQALQRLRERAARFEPVEGPRRRRRRHRDASTSIAKDPDGKADERTRTSRIELGAKANPPGFDEQLLGLEAGATKIVHDPLPGRLPDCGAGRTPTSSYTVTVKGIKRRVAPRARRRVREGSRASSRTLDALRARVREDLEHEARHAAEREVRGDADEAAGRAGAVRGAGLAHRARDRSAPRGVRAPADRPEHRPAAGGHRLERVPREPARGGARSGGAARSCSTRSRGASSWRSTEEEIEQRDRAATRERTGRTPAAVRAALEKEGGLSRVYAGLRREKSIDFLMARATIAGE